jgi:hypothetical protein
MTTQTETTQRNHRHAVRFFWVLLVGTAIVSVSGNIAHAVLPYIPHVVIQVGAAAVPPIVLLAAVHGIALAVRAGASGTVYRWAVAAVALIGAGAFALSFLALRDLMQVIGYSPATAWIFPAIIDTMMAVSTMMLVALGDKPARRVPRVGTQPGTVQKAAQIPSQSAKAEATPLRSAALTHTEQAKRGRIPAPARPGQVQTVQHSAQTSGTQVDADLASELVASGVTTQSVETVIAVLAARRSGASINAAARASGINYRTAQRITVAAAECAQRNHAVAS